MSDATNPTRSRKAADNDTLRQAEEGPQDRRHVPAGTSQDEKLARASGIHWLETGQSGYFRGSALREALRQAEEGTQDDAWRTLAEFDVASEPGNERQAMEKVSEAVQALNLLTARLEKLKTAVAEAVMNAMEHGNQYRPELPVSIRVLASETTLAVQVTDQGGGQPIPDAERPDLEAKLAGRQSPRGWGLFLIKHMVDEMHVTSDETHHTVELIFDLKGDRDASKTV